jgi:hypothetical protein
MTRHPHPHPLLDLVLMLMLQVLLEQEALDQQEQD